MSDIIEDGSEEIFVGQNFDEAFKVLTSMGFNLIYSEHDRCNFAVLWNSGALAVLESEVDSSSVAYATMYGNWAPDEDEIWNMTEDQIALYSEIDNRYVLSLRNEKDIVSHYFGMESLGYILPVWVVPVALDLRSANDLNHLMTAPMIMSAKIAKFPEEIRHALAIMTKV